LPDSEWVRVRDNETGHHYTVHSTVLDSLSGVTVLKQRATDVNGAPLLDKPRVEKGSTRENTASATEKES
jgi:hypothetical protein